MDAKTKPYSVIDVSQWGLPHQSKNHRQLKMIRTLQNHVNTNADVIRTIMDQYDPEKLCDHSWICLFSEYNKECIVNAAPKKRKKMGVRRKCPPARKAFHYHHDFDLIQGLLLHDISQVHILESLFSDSSHVQFVRQGYCGRDDVSYPFKNVDPHDTVQHNEIISDIDDDDDVGNTTTGVVSMDIDVDSEAAYQDSVLIPTKSIESYSKDNHIQFRPYDRKQILHHIRSLKIVIQFGSISELTTCVETMINMCPKLKYLELFDGNTMSTRNDILSRFLFIIGTLNTSRDLDWVNSTFNGIPLIELYIKHYQDVKRIVPNLPLSNDKLFDRVPQYYRRVNRPLGRQITRSVLGIMMMKRSHNEEERKEWHGLVLNCIDNVDPQAPFLWCYNEDTKAMEWESLVSIFILGRPKYRFNNLQPGLREELVDVLMKHKRLDFFRPCDSRGRIFVREWFKRRPSNDYRMVDKWDPQHCQIDDLFRIIAWKTSSFAKPESIVDYYMKEIRSSLQRLRRKPDDVILQRHCDVLWQEWASISSTFSENDLHRSINTKGNTIISVLSRFIFEHPRVRAWMQARITDAFYYPDRKGGESFAACVLGRRYPYLPRDLIKKTKRDGTMTWFLKTYKIEDILRPLNHYGHSMMTFMVHISCPPKTRCCFFKMYKYVFQHERKWNDRDSNENKDKDNVKEPIIFKTFQPLECHKIRPRCVVYALLYHNHLRRYLKKYVLDTYNVDVFRTISSVRGGTGIAYHILKATQLEKYLPWLFNEIKTRKLDITRSISAEGHTIASIVLNSDRLTSYRDTLFELYPETLDKQLYLQYQKMVKPHLSITSPIKQT